MESLGETLPPLEESVGRNRKDENTVTEMTLLNPKIIPMSMTPDIQTIMQTVFREYVKPKQGGGGRPRKTRRGRRQRKRRRPKRTQRRK
jgi:hypothetical protein